MHRAFRPDPSAARAAPSSSQAARGGEPSRPRDALLPGDPVAVDVFPGRVVTHVGIVSSAGPDGVRVISASARRGGVFDEPLEAFAQGGVVYRPDIPRFVPREEAVARARAHLGRRYHVLARNCEHLVYEALGHRRRSPQLAAFVRGVAATAAGVAAVVGATLLARSLARRRA